jgi:carbamoyl-phosphate synthase large subunit
VSEPFTLLVSSAGRRVELIECFRRAASSLALPLKVIACDVDPDLSAACHKADKAYAVPRCDDPGFVDALLILAREEGVRLIIPTIDPELEPLSEAVPRFQAIGTHVHVSPPATVSIARDKLLTARVLGEAGVPVPATMALGDDMKAPADARWPLLMKPRGGSASRGLKVLHSVADLPETVEEPMILQELLHGPEYTVNLFIDREGSLRCAVPHRRLRVRAGEVEKGRTERNQALAAITEALVGALEDARGVLCFQAIVDHKRGPVVFEINARFGGGYPLADHAGAHFARWLLEEATGRPVSAHDSWREGVLMLRYDAAVFG